MEQTKESKVNAALLNFADYLNKAYNAEFFVSGSLALREAGLALYREPEDIDIFIRLEEKTMKLCDELYLLHKANYIPGENNGYPSSNNLPYTFKWMGVKVNAWFYKGIQEAQIFRGIHGIRFCGVLSVLQAKAVYGRDKDIEDMVSLMDRIREKLGIAIERRKKDKK